MKKLDIGWIHIAFFLTLLAGIFIGYIMGYANGVFDTVDYGMRYLEVNNITLEVNEVLLKNDILQYKHRLGIG